MQIAIRKLPEPRQLAGIRRHLRLLSLEQSAEGSLVHQIFLSKLPKFFQAILPILSDPPRILSG